MANLIQMLYSAEMLADSGNNIGVWYPDISWQKNNDWEKNSILPCKMSERFNTLLKKNAIV